MHVFGVNHANRLTPGVSQGTFRSPALAPPPSVSSVSVTSSMSSVSSILSPVPRNFTFSPQLGQIPPYPGNGHRLDRAAGSSGGCKRGLASGGHEVRSFIPLLLSFFVLHSSSFVLHSCFFAL